MMDNLPPAAVERRAAAESRELISFMPGRNGEGLPTGRAAQRKTAEGLALARLGGAGKAPCPAARKPRRGIAG
ncbi:hypothetical protein VB636_16900 [Paracoccus sp. APAP_BH8]|uniref:Uncharacterized protein n=1 Tax=Paracoccus pantotrophus TaxID=82367 RepID=A0AAE6NSN6_PARPN|nr:hypothetical protein [Paracoccus pantotrophus]QFG35694.1 hypothetical protein ESD82_05925 [Paracoccus pantotrophus]